MVVLAVIFILGIVGMLVLRRKDQICDLDEKGEYSSLWKKWGYIPQIMCAVALLGIISMQTEPQILKNGSLKRAAPGEGVQEQTLEVTIPGLLREYPFTISLPEQSLTTKEKQAYLKQAVKELEEKLPGENSSLEQVSADLKLPESLQGGLVQAEYEFDDYELINQDGTLNQEAMSEQGKTVMISVHLTCQEEQLLQRIPACIKLKKRSKAERVLEEAKEIISQNEQKQAEDAWVSLPQTVSSYSVEWKAKPQTPASAFVALGILAIVAVYAGKRIQESQRKEKRKSQLQLAYPDMVSQLMLLLGAGMSVRGVWERMVQMYETECQKGRARQPVYEEMRITYREIKDGIGEIHAYERFADRIGLQSYRRIVSLLSQNIKKGSRGLSQLLEHEVTEAFEERKNSARKLGEEAGTKLLLPMMFMLGIVLVMILVPILMTLNV